MPVVNAVNLWLRSANTEALHSEAWLHMQAALEVHMKAFIDTELENEHAREILFVLSGESFVLKHYNKIQNRTPHILQEPYMKTHVRTALLEEYNNTLVEYVTTQMKASNLAKEFATFQERVNKIYKTYLKKKITAASIPASDERQATSTHTVLGEHFNTVHARAALLAGGGEIEAEAQLASQPSYEIVGESIATLLRGTPFSNPKQSKCKILSGLHQMSSLITPVQSPAPDTMHEHTTSTTSVEDNVQSTVEEPFDMALQGSLEANERELYSVIHGRLLPMSLRHFVWERKLFNARSVTECERTIHSNALATLITDPCESAVSRLLGRIIAEAFTSHLSSYDTFLLRTKESEVLNQLYVFSASQSSAYIFLLLPFLLVFPTLPTRGGTMVSMFYNFISETIHGGNIIRGDLYDGSQRIVRLVSERHSQLYEHLNELLEEQKKSISLGIVHEKSQGLRRGTLQSLHELFLPWLENALVGWLRHDAVFYVWDTCFLSNRSWSLELEHFCVDLLFCIRETILTATTMTAVQEQLRPATQAVFTRDIQRGYHRRCKT